MADRQGAAVQRSGAEGRDLRVDHRDAARRMRQEMRDRQAGAADLDDIGAAAHGMGGEHLAQAGGGAGEMRQQHAGWRVRPSAAGSAPHWPLRRRLHMVRPHSFPALSQPGMTRNTPPDAFYDILRGVAALTGNPVVGDLARLVADGMPPELWIAFNHKQIASKRWLVDALAQVLPRPDGPVWVLGAWYGVLGALLLDDERLAIPAVVSLDLDPACAPVAETAEPPPSRRRALPRADRPT